MIDADSIRHYIRSMKDQLTELQDIADRLQGIETELEMIKDTTPELEIN